METLRDRWRKLGKKFTEHEQLLDPLWEEIKQGYTESHRAYHNLDHLRTMLGSWDRFQGDMRRPDLVAITIFYHDIVYKPTRKDNEAQSAVVMKRACIELGVAAEDIRRCEQQILATQSHRLPPASEKDTAYVLDIDLEVLGKPWEVYQAYCQAIRQEYRMYPRPIYRMGRKKVLRSLLDRAHLYHTSHFQETYEKTARENLQRELMEL